MEDKKEEIEKLPAEVRANMLSNETSVYFNVALFEQVQRVATIFANSTMVREHFRKNIGNCMIALNYAYRLKADEFMVFQNLYVVNGNPGIEGKLVAAVINQSNKYAEPLQYEWLDPDDNLVSRQEVLKATVPSEYGCQAFTIDKKSGKRVTGPKITWELIKAKGWYDKKGPDGTLQSNNWRAMPEQMFYYRSDSWFANKNCPELTLGMSTVEELQDITELRKMPNGSFAIEAAAEKLKEEKSPQTKKDIYATKDIVSPEKPIETKEPDEPPSEDAHEASTKEAEDPISKFKGLTPRKFKILLNKEINEIPKMTQEHQDIIKALWDGHFPGQQFPILIASDASLPPEKDKTEKSDPPITLLCPKDYKEVEAKNDSGRVDVQWCENNCNPAWRGTCVPFFRYQENIGG